MANETTDCSDAKKIGVCLQFVKDGKIYERLLQLVEATDLSGEGTASQLLSILRNEGISPNFMIGHCYEGASTLFGEHVGVQKHVKDQCPTTIHTHCVSHGLSFCIFKVCNKCEIQACMSTIKTCRHIFSYFEKHLSLLHAQIHDQCPDSSHSRLKRHCSTR